MLTLRHDFVALNGRLRRVHRQPRMRHDATQGGTGSRSLQFALQLDDCKVAEVTGFIGCNPVERLGQTVAPFSHLAQVPAQAGWFIANLADDLTHQHTPHPRQRGHRPTMARTRTAADE